MSGEGGASDEMIRPQASEGLDRTSHPLLVAVTTGRIISEFI